MPPSYVINTPELVAPLSQVHYKLADFEKAKDACIESLKLDNGNVGTIVIAVNVCIARGEYEEAEQVVGEGGRAARERGDENGVREIEQAKGKLKKKRMDYRRREKDMAKRMGEGMGGGKGKKNEKGGGEVVGGGAGGGGEVGEEISQDGWPPSRGWAFVTVLKSMGISVVVVLLAFVFGKLYEEHTI